MSAAITSESPLLFNWGPPRPRKRALAIFLLASAAAHAFCFYLFQIVYPPSVALLPPIARATVISPATEDGRALLRWIESEDPALTMTTMRPPDSRLYALPKIDHVPSYAAWTPVLREMPAPQVHRGFPSVAPPGPVPASRPPPLGAKAPVPTTIILSEELQPRGEIRPLDSKFETSMLGAPDSVRFRVAVNRFGEVRYCLPANSSGDSALDQQARSFIARSRFAPIPADHDSDTWGLATVVWGSDVKRSASTPAP